MPEDFLKIKLIVADSFRNRRRNQWIDWQARPHTNANLRGGYRERETLQGPAAKGRWRSQAGLPGSRNDDEFDQVRQFICRAPFRQLDDVVRANEVKKRRLGETPRIIADGIDCIRNPAAQEFLRIDFTGRLAG